MLMFDLIMLCCMLPVLGMEYVMLRNQAACQKGLLLGVTLPAGAAESDPARAIAARFRRELKAVTLLCGALAVPPVLARTTWVALTLWMLWLCLAMALPFLPFIRANRALRECKRALTPPAAQPPRRVDPAASEAALPRPIALWELAAPLAVSLVPVFLPATVAVLRWVYLADAACLALLWACGRWLFRRRADMVTGDTALNQTLLRVRRLYWDRFFRLNLWACAALNLGIGLLHGAGALTALTLLFTLAVLGGTLWMELAVRRAQQKLTAGAEVVADEDDAWIWGLFYYAPRDPHTVVAKRVGLGTTVNLATAGGKALTAFAAAALALCLFIGPVLGILDGRPTRLVISGQTLTALHGGSEKYALPLDGITDVQLRDALPEASRTFGTGLDHYCQGDFYVTGEGSALFCLDPTAPVFLRVEAEGQVYWFTAETEEQTRAMARWLQQRRPGG